MKTMNKFIDLEQELGLKKLTEDRLGTLYLIPVTQGFPKVMIRHFNRHVPITLVDTFANLLQRTQQWIEQYPELARIIKVEQPLEVGLGYDFITRPHHMYSTSTHSYLDWDNPPEPPDELEQMRTIFRNKISKSTNPKDIVIEMMLSRSLLEPSYKTYFAESKGQFIVVEPELTPEYIQGASQLCNKYLYL